MNANHMGAASSNRFARFFSLSKSYFTLNRCQAILWNILGRYLVPKQVRRLFEGNRKIPGQLWLVDRQVIYDAVKTYRPAHVYEVGTWKGGGSTFFIAQALSENGAGLLHTVEIDERFYSEAKANYARHASQLLPFIDFNLGTSTQIYPAIAASQHADLVFLDGLDGEQTLRDFQIFEPTFTGGEILIAHDWNDEKTSRLRPYLEANRRWKPVTIIGSPGSVGIAVYRFDPGEAVENADGLAVPVTRWQAAQASEKGTWQEIETAYNAMPALKRWLLDSGIYQLVRRKPPYDDWNTWWRDCFDGYSFLPPQLDRALEIGCGPYTNLRLIREASRMRVMLCSDPLVGAYAQFRHGWLARAFARRSVALVQHPGELIPLHSASIDCVVLINVLDHVLDAQKCLLEALRILKPGGCLILGQDLTDQEDMRLPENLQDIGHPIRLVQSQIDSILFGRLNPVLFRVLDREQGRAPRYHIGTYLFAGTRLPD